MSSVTDIVVLAVCEDGKWGVAGRYPPGRTQRAISDAKLMMRAGGIAAARVLRHALDPRTRAACRELLFDDVKPGVEPPPAPAYATPSGDRRDAAAGPAPMRRPAPPATVRAMRAAPLPVPAMPARRPDRGGTTPRAEQPAGPSFGAFFAQLGALFSFRQVEQEPLAIPVLAVPEAAPSRPPEASAPRREDSKSGSPSAKKLLEFLALCLAEAASVAGVPDARLDAKIRFGLHLLVLGAGETCLSAENESLLADGIGGALAALGSDQDAAARLVGSRNGYAQDPKPASMMRAGAQAMAAFLAGAGDARTILADAFRSWNGVGLEEAQPRSAGPDIAIMFTDMVSSVETTQALGEEGMMRLLSQHDLIVAAVLKIRRGHQVKHTGDGIMAVFPCVADGIAAAADIQRDIAAHNDATAGAPLKVRIGLSAGNPIRKEDDYFGTVVQTAARVCPVAAAGEVALPQAMTILPGCDSFRYSEPVLVPLKGFAEPQPVRKLVWDQAAA